MKLKSSNIYEIGWVFCIFWFISVCTDKNFCFWRYSFHSDVVLKNWWQISDRNIVKSSHRVYWTLQASGRTNLKQAVSLHTMIMKQDHLSWFNLQHPDYFHVEVRNRLNLTCLNNQANRFLKKHHVMPQSKNLKIRNKVDGIVDRLLCQMTSSDDFDR